MLQELYEYAQRNSLTARPGFRPLRPKVYVLLSASGGFIGVDPGPEREVMCPDIGSMANGPSKCNIFVEKSEILLEENRKQKTEEGIYGERAARRGRRRNRVSGLWRMP